VFNPSTKKPEMLMTKASSIMTKNFAPSERELRFGMEGIGAAKVLMMVSLKLTLYCKVVGYRSRKHAVNK
jgi:hypothetical protein